MGFVLGIAFAPKQMNDSDRWVSHNLQRQRELLERQRQRRLQANLSSAVSRTGPQTDPWGGEGNGNAIQRSGSGTNFGPESQQLVSFSTSAAPASGERQDQSRGSLYSFLSSPSPAMQQNAPSNNPFGTNSFGSSNATLVTLASGEPKIITVKGITPPQSRRQSNSSDEANPLLKSAALRRPVLNVDRLEPMSASINSEDEGKALHSLRIADRSPHSHSQLSPSSTTALASKRASWNGEEDDDGSIPTEILNEEPLETLDVSDNLEQFVMDPVRKNCTLKCRITRDKRGVDKGMYPTYYLHLEKNDGRRTFLLAARKRKKSATANYLISIDPTDLRRNGRSFIAKVRSNAMGTMFTIYDNGESPKKSHAIGDGVRRELAAVIYETNVLGLKGPRKMTIVIPGIYVDQKHNYVRPLAVRPISEKDSILERYKTNRLDEMVVLNNKQPVWNEDTQSYVLNFHGRVTQASVKNFQIVHSLQAQSLNQSGQRASLSPDPNEYVIMQFGRTDNESFTMDVRYPLSPVQAFGIAMSSFHGKLACE